MKTKYFIRNDCGNSIWKWNGESMQIMGEYKSGKASWLGSVCNPSHFKKERGGKYFYSLKSALRHGKFN